MVTLASYQTMQVVYMVDQNMYAFGMVYGKPDGTLLIFNVTRDPNNFANFSSSGMTLQVSNSGTGSSKTAYVNYIRFA